MPRRLSPVDLSWLEIDVPGAPRHCSGVTIYEGEPLDIDRRMAALELEVEAIPRMRQKLVRVPFGLGRPVLVDDESFDMRHHVRHVALPAPGTEEQLVDLASEMISTPLDRARPLWERWFVDGLPEGRWAEITKMHHCLIDGIGYVRGSLAAKELEHTAPWRPEPAPTRRKLVADALRDKPADFAEAFRRPPKSARIPLREQIATLRRVLRPVARLPLNVEISPHRRIADVDVTLDELRTIGHVLGGTVNDVALTIYVGGLREWLVGRRVALDGLKLAIGIPVSMRDEGDVETANDLSALIVTIPADESDAVALLGDISSATAAAKAERQTQIALSIMRIVGLWSPAMGFAARLLNRHQRQMHTVLANIAGMPAPDSPLRIRRAIMPPMGPSLAPNVAVAATLTTYSNGQVAYCIIADPVTIPDFGVIASGMQRTLDELSSRATNPADSPQRSPVEPSELRILERAGRDSNPEPTG